MCQAKDRFIFCSCVDRKQGPKGFYFSWTLSKYVGSKESRIRGRIKIPEKDLGNGVTVEAICEQLNSSFDSFDFDYTPSERDTLDIRVPHSYRDFEYFILIFRNGIWESGRNPVFTSVTEKIANGRIKKITAKKQTIAARNSYLMHTKEGLDAILSRVITNRSTDDILDKTRRKIQREPHVFFKIAKKDITSKKARNRYFGCSLLAIFYDIAYKKDEVRSMLIDLLQKEEHPEIISFAISIFNRHNHELSEDTIDLICSFKHLESDVKFSIMTAFQELKYEKVVDTLIEFSSDEDPEIRKTALYNLRQIIDVSNSEKIQKAMWIGVEDAHQAAKLEAIFGLAECKDARVKDHILKELETVDVKSSLLLDAIEALQDKSFIPHLETLIEKHQNTDPYLTKFLSETLQLLQ